MTLLIIGKKKLKRGEVKEEGGLFMFVGSLDQKWSVSTVFISNVTPAAPYDKQKLVFLRVWRLVVKPVPSRCTKVYSSPSNVFYCWSWKQQISVSGNRSTNHWTKTTTARDTIGPTEFPYYANFKLFFCCTSLPLSSENFLETPRIEPGAAGWEARTLPLCYAAPPPPNFKLFMPSTVQIRLSAVTWSKL